MVKKIVLYAEDLEKVTRFNAKFIEEEKDKEKKYFSKEVQDLIFENMKDKLRIGIEKLLEEGFEINFSDAFHAHVLLVKEQWESVRKKHDLEDEVPLDGALTPSILKDVTEKFDVLIFHAEEHPSKEKLSNPAFWNKYKNRTICVDDTGAFILKPQGTPEAKAFEEKYNKIKKIKGHMVSMGALREDYDALKGTEHADMSEHHLMDICFAVDETDGIQLSKKLPKIKFYVSYPISTK